MPGDESALLTALRGRFVVFDGPDGCGKSTQLHRLARYAEQQGLTVTTLRDPGGTEVGERIRELLLDPAHEEMNVRCEMLLYMASRAQLVAQRIEPALAEGRLVLCDRFLSATLAYQGAAGGLEPDVIDRVGDVALAGRRPDLTVLLDVDEAASAARLQGAPKRRRDPAHFEPTLFSDRIEQKGEAHQRTVREGFLAQAERAPDRHLVVDGVANEETVFARVLEGLRRAWGV
jgi:dTMP kinase